MKNISYVLHEPELNFPATAIASFISLHGFVVLPAWGPPACIMAADRPPDSGAPQ
jgi:hypothetical protein